MKHRKKVLPVAVIAAGAMLAASGGAALGASHVRGALIATPELTVTMSGTHSFHVSGPRHISAGRVDVTLIAKKGEQEVGFGRLHHGYSYADASRDFGLFFSSQNPTPAGLKALNRVVRHVTFFGGIDSGTGHKVVNASVVLPKAGTYFVFDDDQGPGAVPPVKLHVSKRAGHRITPTSSATVKTSNAKRFTGSTTLPAAGTITFANTATNTPHFLSLQHVSKGTTRRQIIQVLNGSGPPPSFLLKDTLGTDVVSPGHSQTLSYKLPAGEYAEMCFFPDLKTGMPHALMGMVRIVHLK
jgi:hypothetical protein